MEPFGVAHDAATPLYLQVKDVLKTGIAQGRYRPGDRLPSERTLAGLFGVSRVTIRQAIQELIREGVLFASVGRGTFIADQKLEYQVKELRGFTEELRARGYHPSSRVYAVAVEPLSERVRAAFEGEPPARVARVERLRLANEQPIAYEVAYLNYDLCPGIEERDLSGSVYNVLSESYGVRLVRAKQRIEARLPDEMTSKRLGITEQSPCLLLCRQSFDASGTMVEYVEALFRGDRYSVTATLGAPAPRNE